ncbi:MAG: NAD(P)-binding protein, partial [Rhodospirillaceae bacterium]|nr:NAD(P)-binding protein [Rhodospirillaceae bacterium]
MTITKSCDVAIIGAGPAGAVAASLLAAKGYDTVILERQEFPRFSIGESLLPQCMEVLDEAGMLDAVVSAKFQLKNGAAFERNGDRAVFDFSDKFSLGCSTAFEVQRDRFDKILADRAAASGAAVHYRCEITGVDLAVDQPVLSYLNADGTPARL